MITPIITAPEADAYLAAYPDWLALDVAVKDSHIYNASLYIQTQYSCLQVDGTAIDWTDTASIPEEIKHACALYANADSVGNLYGDTTTPDSRRLTREMIKAGAVTIDTYYSLGGTAQHGSQVSFGLANQLMGLYCTNNISSYTSLTRV